MDYKTNRITAEKSTKYWLEHYKMQLWTYKKALHELTDTEVAETGIYFLGAVDENPYCVI